MKLIGLLEYFMSHFSNKRFLQMYKIEEGIHNWPIPLQELFRRLTQPLLESGQRKDLSYHPDPQHPSCPGQSFTAWGNPGTWFRLVLMKILAEYIITTKPSTRCLQGHLLQVSMTKAFNENYEISSVM